MVIRADLHHQRRGDARLHDQLRPLDEALPRAPPSCRAARTGRPDDLRPERRRLLLEAIQLALGVSCDTDSRAPGVAAAVHPERSQRAQRGLVRAHRGSDLSRRALEIVRGDDDVRGGGSGGGVFVFVFVFVFVSGGGEVPRQRVRLRRADEALDLRAAVVPRRRRERVQSTSAASIPPARIAAV